MKAKTKISSRKQSQPPANKNNDKGPTKHSQLQKDIKPFNLLSTGKESKSNAQIKQKKQRISNPSQQSQHSSRNKENIQPKILHKNKDKQNNKHLGGRSQSSIRSEIERIQEINKKLTQIDQASEAKKRQSNSYHRPYALNQSETKDLTFHNDSLNIFTHHYNERQSERLRQNNSLDKISPTNRAVLNTDLENTSVLDGFYENKYKLAQKQYLECKKVLNSKDQMIETLQASLRKQHRDIKLIEEKSKILESQLNRQTIKKQKYQQLSKQCKAQVDMVQSTLLNLKQLSHSQISDLNETIQSLNKKIDSERNQSQITFSKIQSYLERIKNMLVPNDQNYGFNIKILGDLMNLCEQHKFASSTNKHKNEKFRGESSNYPNHSNFIKDVNQRHRSNQKIIQSEELSLNDSQFQDQKLRTLEPNLLSNKTQRLLDDYEKLRYESDSLRLENQDLKQKVSQSRQRYQVQDVHEPYLHILSTYDSKNSQYQPRSLSRDTDKNDCQSLSVADLQHLNSVQMLNEKLEQKNLILEKRLQEMHSQMNDLASQTNQIQQDRQIFKQQIEKQNQYINQFLQNNDRQGQSIEAKYPQRNMDTSAESNTYATIQSNQEIKQNRNAQIDTKRFNNLPQNSYKIQEDEKTKKLYNPYNLSPTTSECQSAEQQVASFNYIDLENINQRNTELSSNLLSQREDQSSNRNQNKTYNMLNQLSTDRQSSKIDKEKLSQRMITNVFKRTNMESINKENNYKFQFNQQEIQNQKENQDSLFKPTNVQKPVQRSDQSIKNQLSPERFNNTLGQPLSSKREVGILNLNQFNQRTHSMHTLRKPPSLGSTATLIMNEKARALKDEIINLDDEIQQLQKNLKRAISKRETNS